MCGIHFYSVNCKLNDRLRCDRDIYCLVVYDLDGVQVVRGVQSLEILKILPI